MPEKTPVPQVAFSPREFAALFKKEQSWGYRQIYAGKVITITEYGRIMIPASEVERILASAARYEGQKKPPVRTKKEFESMKPELQTAWQAFVQGKRSAATPPAKRSKAAALPRSAAAESFEERRAALKRLTAGKDVGR